MRIKQIVTNASLKLRLTLLTTLFISTALIVTAILLVNIFNNYAENQVKQELLIHLNQLTAEVVIGTDGRLSLDTPLSDPRFSTPYSGLYWQVNALDSIDVLRSRSLWEEEIQLDTKIASESQAAYQIIKGPPDENLMVLSRQVELGDQDPSTYLLSIALDQAILLNSLAEFRQILVIAFVVLTIGMIIMAWVQIQLSLTPLNQIKVDLTAISQGSTRTLEGNYPKEILPLVNAFNEVLNHDTQVLTRARTQAGNLAHSLKTPLTILSQAAQNSQKPTDLTPHLLDHDVKIVATNQPENWSEMQLTILNQVITHQVKQIKQFIDYHLAQTRAAASAQIPGQRTDVLHVINSLIKTMEVLYKDKGLIFTVEAIENDIYFRGESQDLYEMLGNLLDNACKWATKKIQIKIENELPHMHIFIEDDGHGLPAEKCASVLERGVRMDEQVSGSGIGLWIVKDLSLLYQGNLVLKQGQQGGLVVKLSLPLWR